MNPTLRTILAVVSIGVITLCLVLIVGRAAGRTRVADLTERDLYTLSQGTRNILAKLRQPITLKLYYARTAARKGPEQIRRWNNYFIYVRDLLEEYVRLSEGKLTLQVIDPRPFSEEEEEALKYGLHRIPLAGDEAFFFGLVATTELGKDRVIEFFDWNRQQFVEYDVSKLISDLMQREKKKIGLISSLPVMGTDMSPYMRQMLQAQGRQPEEPWTLLDHLRETYQVEKVEAQDAAIPDDIDFLVVIHPKDLDSQTLYAIDQYVMAGNGGKGGRLVVFVDPHCLMDRPMMPQNQFQAMQHETTSDLNKLLKKWGVKLSYHVTEDEKGNKKIVDVIAVDPSLALKVPLRRNQPPVRFPAFVELNEKCVNRQQVITAQLHSLRLLFPGVLEKTGGAETELVPLLETTNAAREWRPSDSFQLMALDADVIRKNSVSAGGELLLACLLTGKFQTNFPDGIEIEVPAEAEEEKPEQETTETEEPEDEKAPAQEPQDEAPEAEGDQDPPEAQDEEPADPADPPNEQDPPEGEAEGQEADEAPEAQEPQEAPEPEEAEEPASTTRHLEPVKEAGEGAAVVVVADVDFLSDQIAYQPTPFGMAQAADNASLLLNALEFLGGSEDLIAIRSRGEYNRPFEVVEEIERKAEEATAEEVAEVNRKIQDYEKQRRELDKTATEENISLVQDAALQKRRKLEADIREAKGELRQLKKTRREEVEELYARLRVWNMAAAPLTILAVAIALALVRWIRAKRYVARRRS
ncbi:MAG: Gldg family protein [Candidatus Brocadiia bacterium]